MLERPVVHGWRFAIDRGGTFTDIVAWNPDGRVYVHKLLSQVTGDTRDPALRGIEAILGRADAGTSANGPGSSAVAETPIEWLRIGTTVVTNALLERKGEPTLLVTTRGFADALRIGHQQRPDIFAREIRLRPTLYTSVVEADERVDASGSVIVPLDEPALESALLQSRQAGFDAIAICFMHAAVAPAHERRAAKLARALGFREVVASHEIAALQGFVARGDTAVADAYLSPVLSRYLVHLREALAQRALNPMLAFMQSHGGLAEAAGVRGVHAVLSGPAGGVVGMIAAGEQAGEQRLLGFDMGGTSTDVSLYCGMLPRRTLTEIDGVRLQVPMMDVQTIAAGGGSILRYHDGRLLAGPHSAGSDPGPACYRRGGPATLTDCNVLLGRIQARSFPAIFGPDADLPLDVDASRRRLDELAAGIERDSGRRYDTEELATAFVEVADAGMANAVRELALRHGHDPARFALVCFGGAAGQHACAIAERLGIERIVVHPLGGVLSAYGIGLATRRSVLRHSVESLLDGAGIAAARSVVEALSHEVTNALQRQGVAAGDIEITSLAALRRPGSDTVLDVAWSTLDSMQAAFESAYRRLYGLQIDTSEIVISAVSVEAVERADASMQRASQPGDTRPNGQTCDGPAVVVEDGATIWIAPGWRGRVDGSGMLLLERSGRRAARLSAHDCKSDPKRLEVFNGIFMHVAEQMGAVLRQTASSVNIKERLDFSCAIFDAQAGLVANAPHMPVHLGSMGASVAAVVVRFGQDLRAGDSYLLNSPYDGGTHLPDLTVVTPVFDRERNTVTAFVASRAHHADIGGMTPGSMPPWSRTIDDEGVLISPTRIVRDGVLDEAGLRRRLSVHRHPARDPERNLEDLRAQLAANARGIDELARAADEHGAEVLSSYMVHIQDNAERCMRNAIRSLGNGTFRYELDNRQAIVVALTIDRAGGDARIDFTGTSPQLDNNFNAPRAVTVAAVLYVFRTLIAERIPMNAGCLRPLAIHIPPGCMLDPAPPGAVVAGNVETSQCIVDALYGALGLQAAAQGTMNNFTFGNAKHQYYETVAGGAGAGPDYDGASGVQTHMTNSRLTDPEVLEHRFPVRLREFSLRRGSGGRGCQRGGDGIRRSVEFLEAMTVAILANRRRVPPFGLAGGEPGATGFDRVLRRDGREESLTGCAQIAVEPGDVVTLETPGGGGYGER